MNVQLSLLSLIISDEIHNTLLSPPIIRMNKSGQDILVVFLQYDVLTIHVRHERKIKILFPYEK